MKKTKIQQTDVVLFTNSLLRLLIAVRFSMIMVGVCFLSDFQKLAEYMSILMMAPFLWMTCKIYMSDIDWLTWKSPLDERLLEFRFGAYALLTTWIPLFFIVPPIHSELSSAKFMMLAFVVFCLFLMMGFELLRFKKLIGYFSGEN